MTGAARSNRGSRLLDRASGRLLAAGFGLALLFAPVAAHADFAQGVKAYEAGDHKAAFEAWLPLAENGDVAAMRNIGHLYRWGQGVEKDIRLAVQWYRKAAEMGFSRAQANLASIYLQGDEGVPVDYAEAYKWFAAAAVQNLAVAQYNLGLMYELGLGIQKSEPRALGWYNLAAKAGQPEAIERLSQLVKTTEAPLVSGVNIAAPQAASADDRTEAAGSAAAPPTPAVAVPGGAAMPADPAPIANPVQAASAPAPVAAPPAAPAPEVPPEEDRPGLLGRFYSAISSGGGVSIPDIFKSSPEPATDSPPESSPAEGQSAAPDGSRKAGDPEVRP